jgi:hypothetical protein
MGMATKNTKGHEEELLVVADKDVAGFVFIRVLRGWLWNRFDQSRITNNEQRVTRNQ